MWQSEDGESGCAVRPDPDGWMHGWMRNLQMNG